MFGTFETCPLAVLTSVAGGRPEVMGRLRVPGDRDHQFQAIVITDSGGA